MTKACLFCLRFVLCGILSAPALGMWSSKLEEIGIAQHYDGLMLVLQEYSQDSLDSSL